MNEDVRRAEQVIPGACFGYTRLPDDLMFAVSHGRGSRFWTTDGREFLDYTLGSGPLVIGHAHPAVVDAVTQQVGRGTHFYALNATAVDLAEYVVGALESVEAVKLCADGSQATFFAMRLARAATGRPLVLKFAGAYHGHHDYALPGFAGTTRQFGPARSAYQGTPSVVDETVLVAPFNDIETTSRLVRQHGQDIAAIIVEPVQRAIEPHTGFLSGLRSLCDEIGAKLIFDEVVTGFRLDRGGAQRAYEVRADLTALGKAVGGGLPLGVIGGTKDLIDQVVPGDSFTDQRVFMSGTLNGNPLSAAAGLATLQTLDRVNGPKRIARHGRALAEGLRRLIDERGIDAQVIGPDAFIEVVFGRGAVRDEASYLATDRGAAEEFGRQLITKGIYVVPGTKLYISTEHDDRDVDWFLSSADEAFGVLADRRLIA